MNRCLLANRNISYSIITTSSKRIRSSAIPLFCLFSDRELSTSGSSSFYNDLLFNYPLINSENNRRKKGRNKKTLKKSGKPSYRLVDKTHVRVTGGTGGKGSLSFERIRRGGNYRPDGGHGGNGGNVFIVADPKQQTLKWSQQHHTAEHGTHGSSQDKYGRTGKNKILRVPCGVVVKRILDHDETWDPERKMVIAPDDDNTAIMQQDKQKEYVDFDDYNWPAGSSNSSDNHDDTESDYRGGKEDENLPVLPVFDDLDDDEFTNVEERQKVILADLDNPGAHVLVARGGKGGIGSGAFAGKRRRIIDKILVEKSRPTEGEVAYLELELKMIADIGLVGFPNAGKSSLLCAMSRAAPEVAPYPFTTLHPFVGVVEYQDGYNLRAADVPGLIEGAHQGRGKGHDFLRHLERTKALLYIVDAAGVDGRDPIQDLEVLTHELSSYGDGDMLNRSALVVANKMDLVKNEEKQQQILSDLDETAREMGINVHGDVIGISAGVTGTGLRQLSKSMRNIVTTSETRHATIAYAT